LHLFSLNDLRDRPPKAPTLTFAAIPSRTQAAVALAALPEEEGVLVLDDSNFQEALAAHAPLLVECACAAFRRRRRRFARARTRPALTSSARFSLLSPLPPLRRSLRALVRPLQEARPGVRARGGHPRQGRPQDRQGRRHGGQGPRLEVRHPGRESESPRHLAARAPARARARLAHPRLALPVSSPQFPTLKFFTSAAGAPVEYNGGRETADIVKWVKSKSGPATVAVASAADLAKLADKELLALGFFAEAGSEAEKAFNAAAIAAEDAAFAVVGAGAADVRATFGVTGDAVVFLTRFAGDGEKRIAYEGALTDSKALSDFVVANSLPLVVAFTQESAPKIFRGAIKTHFLLFVDPAAGVADAIKADFAATAASFKGRALFVTVAPSEDRIVSYFGITKEQMPAAVLVSMPEGEPMKKFAYDAAKPLDAAGLGAFAESFFKGELKPFLKSEEVPTALDNGVTVVVGKNFAEVALAADKDVLLEFYAPWCGHCKQLAPEYEKLAARFAGVPHVTIAKMDATANEIDHPGVNVKGFPTLYFFPKGEAKTVVEYDGARDLDGLTAFLKKNVKTPFTLPEGAGAGEDDLHEL